MKLTRRSFFSFLGGAAAATAVAPAVLTKKALAVPEVSGKVMMAKHQGKAVYGRLVTPDAFAQAFLNELKSKLIVGQMADGKD